MIVGMKEMLGCIEGMEDGASLCDKAPLTTKSEAAVPAAFPTPHAFLLENFSGSILLSRFRCASTFTSNIPGLITECPMTCLPMRQRDFLRSTPSCFPTDRRAKRHTFFCSLPVRRRISGTWKVMSVDSTTPPQPSIEWVPLLNRS